MGGDGGGGIGQVAGGSAAHGGEAEFAGAGEGHGHHPVLEGERRHVHTVVLDVELLEAKAAGQPIGPQQGREAGAHIDRVPFDGEEFSVAPDGGGAGLDRGAAHPAADGVVVVDDLQGAETDVLTDVAGPGLIGMAAFLAAEPDEGGAGEGRGHGHTQQLQGR